MGGTLDMDEARDEARYAPEPYDDRPDPAELVDLPGDWLWTVERRPT